MRHVIVAAAVVALLLGASAAVDAGIIRIEMTRVESPTFEGRSFGTVGQYEKLVGWAYGELDPEDARNAVITDIALAPRNARGMVEYSADVYILRPVNPWKANGRVIFDLTNRGFVTSNGSRSAVRSSQSPSPFTGWGSPPAIGLHWRRGTRRNYFSPSPVSC